MSIGRTGLLVELLIVGVALAGCSGPTAIRVPEVPSSHQPTGSALDPPPPSALPSQSSAGTAAPGSSSQPPAAPDVAQPARFAGGLLIADRLNGRLLVVDDAGTILWRFPVEGSLPPGQTFSADDAFVAPDGKTVLANEESNQVVVRIDIATEKIIWQYGTYGVKGSAPDQLSTPDDAYPLPNGDVTVSDIRNCRIIEISPASQIVRQWGTAGNCADAPPASFAQPNGDTPLPDGGMLVTEIKGSRVVRLSSSGEVMFDVAVPVRYPSDAQLLANGDILVVDYSNPGAVVVVDPQTGATIYRYGPQSGPGALNRPSLAVPLADGTFAVNDDYDNRVVVIDPTTSTIVWSYGHNGQASTADGYLDLPDGINVAPVGVFR